MPKKKVGTNKKTKPLPGTRQAIPVGMVPFVVNLREKPQPKLAGDGRKSSGRRVVVEQYTTLTREFMEQLRKKLKRIKLEAEVADYGEPNPFPVVTMTCSAKVANFIAKMPEVEGVYRDDEPSLGVY